MTARQRQHLDDQVRQAMRATGQGGLPITVAALARGIGRRTTDVAESYRRVEGQRPAPATLEQLTGRILEEPWEKHAHSEWKVLETEDRDVVRVILPFDQPGTRHAVAGAEVRLTGRWTKKHWADGLKLTFSAYRKVEIVAPARPCRGDHNRQPMCPGSGGTGMSEHEIQIVRLRRCGKERLTTDQILAMHLRGALPPVPGETVRVRFIGSWYGFQSGESGGFHTALALELLERGVAEIVRDEGGGDG
jgi:hypothetical protein